MATSQALGNGIHYRIPMIQCAHINYIIFAFNLLEEEQYYLLCILYTLRCATD